MPIARMRDLLAEARTGRYAVGYFEAWDSNSMEAVLRAAEEARAPAIIGFGAATTSATWYDEGGIELMAAVARSLAERSSVPAAVLFNEARTSDQIRRAMDAGCNAVMLGTAEMDYGRNVRETAAVVRAARERGVDVEAELGHLPDHGAAEGGHGRLTDPGEAERFVAETGVDALAVSVGTTHCRTEVDPGTRLDLERLREISRRARVPLVLHGGSGLPAAAARDAIEAGICKVNYGTRLKKVWLEGLREALAGLSHSPDVQRAVGSREETDILLPGTRELKSLVRGLIAVYGAEGKAGGREAHA